MDIASMSSYVVMSLKNILSHQSFLANIIIHATKWLLKLLVAVIAQEELQARTSLTLVVNRLGYPQ
jgi:hypothetical protein